MDDSMFIGCNVYVLILLIWLVINVIVNLFGYIKEDLIKTFTVTAGLLQVATGVFCVHGFEQKTKNKNLHDFRHLCVAKPWF